MPVDSALAPAGPSGPSPTTVPPFDQVSVAIAPGDDLVVRMPGILLVVGPGVKTGIRVLYDNPREVGPDRILHAVEVFGDPARIHVCPDCGLRTRSWDVAYAKLQALVEGARLAETALVGATA